MTSRFANCEIDFERRTLRRDGVEVRVEPQVFELLVALVRAKGKLVTKEALIETVWKGLNVSDATISARISAARTAVGDDGKTQAIIRTLPKHGFQLNVEVHEDLRAMDDAASSIVDAQTIRFTKSTDGALIAHTHHGQGPPLMRVGHWLSHLELDCECPVWHPMLRQLSEHFTLYRYDVRGTGLSTRDVSNLDLDAFVDDLAAVADAEGLDRFPIFAASQAVPVAIRFAARFPERVSRMVLYAGYAIGRVYREASAGEVEEETILGLIRAGWGQEESAFLKAFTTLFMPDATPEQITSFVHIQRASITAENAALMRMAVDRFVVEEDLKFVTAPTLLVHARSDAIHPMSQSSLLASKLPNAQFMMLESRNHVPLPQYPQWTRLINAVIEFCSET